MAGAVYIGIVGLGCVGLSVVKILNKHQDLLARRCGHSLVIKKGVVKDLSKAREVNFPLSNSLEDILEDPDIQIVLELTGAVELAYQIAKESLKRNKGFITANKAMLAKYPHLLHANIGFEASVGGGIPIIRALKEGLVANEITAIQGIFNGTSNFILSQMSLGKNFQEALKKAQSLGYAEANAHLDVSGQDSAHKLLILAFLAFNSLIDLNTIHVEGIEQIKPSDLHYAKQLGYRIKLVAYAHKYKEGITLGVEPMLLPKRSLLAQIEGVMNGVSLVGDSLVIKKGVVKDLSKARGVSAVISDLVEMSKNLKQKRKPLKLPITPYPICSHPKRSRYIRLEFIKNAPNLVDALEAKLVIQEQNTHIYTTPPIDDQSLEQSLKPFRTSNDVRQIQVLCFYEFY
ncbi:homoserine dehydrogenase [Helicobacter suis]|uniref:homoserine dehydrogenase n=1 Tax=Helicobacter suis TaxID=104628 RepID=UPI0021FD2E12|nr:homoserine dehydrogenase [Helicobacter suis]BDR27420.1 homoserine dehydrogenase [Helicobacter suis HS1]